MCAMLLSVPMEEKVPARLTTFGGETLRVCTASLRSAVRVAPRRGSCAPTSWGADPLHRRAAAPSLRAEKQTPKNKTQNPNKLTATLGGRGATRLHRLPSVGGARRSSSGFLRPHFVGRRPPPSSRRRPPRSARKNSSLKIKKTTVFLKRNGKPVSFGGCPCCAQSVGRRAGRCWR